MKDIIVEKLVRIAEGYVHLSGFSDYKGLLKRCLDKLDKVIDRVYPKGGFTLKMKEEVDKDYNVVKIKLGPGLHTSVRQYAKGYQIDIDTEEHSVEQVYTALAHEITHISQKMNNFHNFQFDMLRAKYKNVKPKNWSTLLDSIHSDLETENEAVMVQIAVALKRGNFEAAAKELLNRHDYFKTWDWRKFATKLYSVGANGKDISKLHTILIEDMDKKISEATKEIKDIGALAFSVTEAAPLLHLIGYDTTKLKTFLLKKIEELDPKPVGNWNWKALKYQIEQL